MTQLSAVARAPTGPGFTVVLVCHVAAVLLALVTAVAGGVAAARVLHATGELAPGIRSYFSSGVNWAGRVLYLVPVFGAVLVAMSKGADPLGSTWLGWGIGLWVAATAIAEGLWWPAERRVQRSLATPQVREVPFGVRRACWTMCVSTTLVVALVVAAMVVMVARP